MTRRLQDLGPLQPLYTVPGDDFIGDVLISAMSVATSLRCMAGFFSSAAFRHVAPGIATFINETEGTFQLLISPALTDADRDAVRTAVEHREAVLQRAAETLLAGATLSESALEQHTLDCLSYLLAAGRLEMKFVLMTDGGMFHPKVWIFHDGRDLLIAHGSSNVTAAGLIFNFEAVSVERSWTGDEARTRSIGFRDLFERLWSGDDPDTLTISLAVGLDLLRRIPSVPPTIEDFWRAWQADAVRNLAPPLPSGRLVAASNPDIVTNPSRTGLGEGAVRPSRTRRRGVGGSKWTGAVGDGDGFGQDGHILDMCHPSSRRNRARPSRCHCGAIPAAD